jgi:hypothetical protein
MTRIKQTVCYTVLMLVTCLVSVQAQVPSTRPLSLIAPEGTPIIPIMEGWYANDDGSVTISFGYVNRNQGDPITIPLGPNNFVEPAEFSGMQPTHFDSGRHHGVFTVTLPSDRRNESIWWHIKTGSSETLKVPGRAQSTAYELDRGIRPQGSLEPIAWLREDGERGTGPQGVIGNHSVAVRAGEQVTLTVHTRDPSVRNPQDPRFREPLTLRLTSFKHQGPGAVQFVREQASGDTDETEGATTSAQGREPQGPEVVILPEPQGSAKIHVVFSEPGEYIIRTRIDNWNAPDSSGGNQCCWTNVFQRVTVIE